MARKPKEKEVDINRLAEAMRRARLFMRRYRENRREMVRQYIGRNWSEESTREKVPVNLLSLYVSVVSRNLIAKNPRVMMSTFNRAAKPTVTAMEAWANQEIDGMKLANTLQRVVLDGLFSVGICKVALAKPADSASVGWGLPSGAPFAARVDLDDFVFDLHARDFSEVSFIGHRYRVPLDSVKDSRVYGPGRKKLEPSTDEPYNLEGDEKISTLQRGVYAGNEGEFEDHINLWEVYLPRHKLVVTLADDMMTGAAGSGTDLGEALLTQNWLGRETGPYHILSYGTVPGNAMPKGPIQDIYDLHNAANNIYRKLIRQAERQKEVQAVRGGAMEDGSRIMEADDGQIIRVDDPQNAATMMFGGPNQQNFLLGERIISLFSYMSGNLDMMGGLSPQSKTLGQDQMLAANASKSITDMQDTTVTFTADVIRSLCWYWHHDPFKEMRVSHTVPGIPDIGITRKVGPLQRQQIPWGDLLVNIDPYSMQHTTPQMRLQFLSQAVQGAIPILPLLQQQGISIDLNKYFQLMAKYGDMPDLPEILTTIPAPSMGQQSTGAGPTGQPQSGNTPATMPPQTKREYIRRSIGSDNPMAQEAELKNKLMAAQPSTNGTTH